jgi:hypothetical protein
MSNSLFHISEFRHNPLMKSHHRREPLDTSSFINCRIMPSFFAPKLLIPSLTPLKATISGSVIQAQKRLVFPISTSSIFASWREIPRRALAAWDLLFQPLRSGAFVHELHRFLNE